MSLTAAVSMDIDSNYGVGHRHRGILALPDELLCIAFTYVADMEPAQGTTHLIDDFGGRSEWQPKRDGVLGWLRLSEVCVRFRAVLLAMAALWARIAFDLPLELGELALVRSQSMSLTASIKRSYLTNTQKYIEKKSHVFDLDRVAIDGRVIQHVTRICSLSIENPSIAMCKKILSAPLPQLEELRLKCGHDYPMDPFQDEGKIHVGAPAVRLAELEFSLTPVYHQFAAIFTFRFPALLSLKINVDRTSGLNLQELFWITDILLTSPLLEQLDLGVITDELVDWSTLFGGRIAAFPCLRSLDIGGTPAMDVPELFKHIGSPRPAHFEVSCCQQPPMASIMNEVDHILNFANTFSALLTHTTHDGLAISVENEDDDDYHMMRLWLYPSFKNPRRCIDSRAYNMSEVIELTIGLALPTDDPVYIQVSDIILKALQGNRVKQLAVAAPSLRMWPGVIEAVMLACPAVTELVIDHNADLKATHQDLSILVFSTDILPALDAVLFKPQIAHDYYDEETDVNLPNVVAYNVVECAQWLTVRARAGRRVRRLCVIGERDEGRDMFARLGEFVDEYEDERLNWS